MDNPNSRMYNRPQQGTYNRNPIIQALNQGTQNRDVITEMINTYLNARNPQQVLSDIIQRNPQMQEVINFVNQNGGNAQNLFYALARQKGIDPDAFLRSKFGQRFRF